MEAAEENGINVTLKRQREPLSDTEDNILPVADGLKRRRLEAAGEENRSPRPCSSRHLAEFKTKPDTPIIPSVQSRLQLLTQRKDGALAARRILSDPGTEGPAIPIKGSREHLLGEEEFHQRLERFKAPASQANTPQTQSPASTCSRTRSDFVSNIQQKLQCSTTPSSKQVSIIRQERELELNQLPFQPISENAWLKRCSSDSLITQGGPPAGSSSPSSRVPVSRKKFCWPPTQPCDVPGETEMKDGSFTELLTSAAKKPSGDMMGEEAPSAEPRLTREGQKESISLGEEGAIEKEPRAVVLSKVDLPESQTVLKLSFSEEHSLSELQAADKNSFLQSTLLEESNTKETSQVFRETEEEQISELFTFDGDETVEGSTCGEEEIEPSTDEELRVWRYPQQEVCVDEDAVLEKKQVFNKKDEPELSREGKENIDGAPDLDVSNKTASFLQQQEAENKRLDEQKSEGENWVDDSLKKGPALKAEALEEKPSTSDLEINSGIVAQPSVKNQTNEKDRAQGSSEIQMSVSYEEGKESTKGRKDVVDELTVHKAERSKKVTFILEPELINRSVSSESDVSEESRAETSLSDAGSGSHDDTNTAETIEKMFEEVLEYAEKVEENRLFEEDGEGHDSGISACSGEKGGMEKSRREEEPKEEESDENDGDELLTFPKGGILSPLSKSVEAVVTPLRLSAAQESNPPVSLTPEETSNPPPETAPFYSIDAYRTQRQNRLPTIQSVTPAVQRRTPETPNPEAPVVTKERITALNEEAGKLQTVINQTLQALSCCTDEEHGRGSLEEAEAEKLLLVSCEKRSALLAEVVRLREERSLQSGGLPKDTDYVSQQPCRGTVTITNIQLPLKVEYVCSSHSRAGRPSHYFFVLIRYGPCNIIATPLATAADARNGDTISFPTAVKLQDIRSSFEIDLEVYSLCSTSGASCSTDRTNTKSRVTPRKLLNTITKSSNTYNCAAPSALNTRRSSNFSLVGSHKITLASLGCSKFPLDKVPFLSPLEGHIYLKLESKGHSDVRHQGFLTMFELISGFGVWNRRYFVLEECNMYWWNNPNDRETKEAEGSIFLSRSPNQCVRPVKRDSCARPFTFELVNTSQPDDQKQEALSKCWFSADTKQERLDWMEKLNQALLDFHTWNSPERVNEVGRVRESIL